MAAALLKLGLLIVGAGVVAFWLSIAVPWVAERLSRGLNLLFCVFVLDSVTTEPVSFEFVLRLYPADVLFFVLALAAGARITRAGHAVRLPFAWWLIGTVQLCLFLRGVTVHGTSAGLEYRMSFYAWVGTVYVASFDYSERHARAVITTYLRLGIVICLVAVARWLMLAFDPAYRQLLTEIDPSNLEFPRVVPATQMMVLGLATVALVYTALRERHTRLWHLGSIGALCLVILVMQHRSVWVATSVGIVAIVYVLWRGRGLQLESAVVKIGLIALLLGIFIFRGVLSDAVGQSIESQAQAALDTETGTFAGRVFGWYQLLDEFRGSGSLVTYAFGFPYGHGYERYLSDSSSQLVEYSPHNFYVELLLRGGFVVLICFIWIAVVTVRSAWKHAERRDSRSLPLLGAMAAGLLVYYIPYGIHYMHVMVWGLLLRARGDRVA